MRKVFLLLVGMLLVPGGLFAGTLSQAQSFLRITEIMYNPSPAPAINSDDQSFEYLKLKNISTNALLSLSGVRFTNGVTFDFTTNAVTSLAPGQTVYVVHNKAAFSARYGASKLVAGEFNGSLSNGGESLSLVDGFGGIIHQFSYSDSWFPIITDGQGFSLVILHEQASVDSWGSKESWWPSVAEPGASALAPILINEVLAHTDLPDVDSIELYNPATTNVNLGGWFLTDTLASPKKYRIPNNTMIPAHGYKVFYSSNSFELGTNGFLLSEYGEQVGLFSGDSNTNLTGYFHGFNFDASPNGVSFGRYVTCQGEERLVLQAAKTLGAANGSPQVGPVVISKIMYHPPDPAAGADSALEEFIELHNITATNVPLWCLYTNELGYGTAAITNTWQLTNAVEYSFPRNMKLAADGRLVVVGFDPGTNAAQVAAFRASYSLSNEVSILGPWQGKLNNSGETIELRYPDKPDVTATNIFVPYVLMDSVSYKDCWAWPAAADGYGAALVRLNLRSYGNEPANWTAQPLSIVGLPDSDGDGMPDWWEVSHGLDPLVADATLDSDHDGMDNFQEYIAGTDPRDASSVLSLKIGQVTRSKFVFGFQAIAGVSYSVQTNASVDQSGWGTWQQVIAASTSRWVNLTNSAPVAASQFYRLAIP